MVRYGRSADDGFLPVASVDTEEEAKALLALTCPVNEEGEYVSPTLAQEQTIERLFEFGKLLERVYVDHVRGKARG